MAEANKSSFLGSISPWNRTNIPPPKSPRQNLPDDGLKQSTGLDHTISLRPSPSLRRYPRDCPPSKVLWYYAVDVPKRKPLDPEIVPEDKRKPPPVPKKLVAFSTTDSQAIEEAFLSLDKGDSPNEETSEHKTQQTVTKVPVNEDYLFDVSIEKRELEPAYWLGPVYEVRRGSWFYQDGFTLTPCDENLANQLEEGYLKVAPWKKPGNGASRSSSQPRSRPASMIMESLGSQKSTGTATPTEGQSNESPLSNTYRLFGAHMSTTVTYQDSTVAYLSSDDFMSRMSSTVYGRFGPYGGTKVVRGWIDTIKAITGKVAEESPLKDKQTAVKTATESAMLNNREPQNESEPVPDIGSSPKRNALERQLSSLAGIPQAEDSEKLAEEEARAQEEKEMEDAREKDGDDQNRQIDHLVLVTHGIGQRLGIRLDSINFVHDVNTLRKTMKAVYGSAPDLQALSGLPKNCRIQVLPVCWRHLLDFPKQSLKQNRKEFDLGDADEDFDDDYPSLQDITVEGVPAVRNLITDLAMDVLLYQSAYREHIASIVQKEANRVYQLFRKRTGFNGKVSFCGHSLGSAILFDILCRQEQTVKNRPRRVYSKTSREYGLEQKDLRLDFDVENFFCLGSPIALFQMLKGRTIAGRESTDDEQLPMSPFDSDQMENSPFIPNLANISMSTAPSDLIPITTSSPKCRELFNIFHPTDPIAYRIEPLISPAMAQLKSQPLPYTKKAFFGAPGIANISARVSQQVMSGWYNLTSGVASSLINRSLGISGDEQALAQDKGKQAVASQATQSIVTPSIQTPSNIPVADPKKQQELADTAKASSNPNHVPTLIDSEIETLFAGFQKRRKSHSSTASDEASGTDYALEQEKIRKLKREEAKVRALNSNGRVDYHIQEGFFDVSLLASIASHLSYWADEDVTHFMIGQTLKKGTRSGE